jgi:hypothetical protein
MSSIIAIVFVNEAAQHQYIYTLKRVIQCVMQVVLLTYQHAYSCVSCSLFSAAAAAAVCATIVLRLSITFGFFVLMLQYISTYHDKALPQEV